MSHQVRRGVREGALFIFGFTAIYFLVSLATYHPADPGWTHSGPERHIANLGGPVGAWFADIFLTLFGYLAYLFPVMVAYAGWIIFRESTGDGQSDTRLLAVRGLGFVLTLAGGCGLSTLHFHASTGVVPHGGGGIIGDLVGSGLVSAVSPLGATLFLLALFLSGVTLFTGLSWLRLMDVTGQWTLAGLSLLRSTVGMVRERIDGRRARRAREVVVREEEKKKINRSPPRIEPIISKIEPSKREARERQLPMFKDTDARELPPLSLLDATEQGSGGPSTEALEAMSRLVELKLADFGIEVEVVAVHPGPVITRFELQPAAGVKVSQITGLAKDLARALSAISVRVVEVIPGKSTIGIEVPNERRDLVRLSETLSSKEYEHAASPLTLALGKDISGKPVVADLARMPHLLVAGTTGSGKSVAINAMVLSLLYNATPDQVRMIMIDPKMLELSVYEGIPHLLAPVVTDMKEAANALRWCVAEMERRYQLMAAVKVRNIGGYNRKIAEAEESGEPLLDPLHDETSGTEAEPLERLPYIVVVVDELADMMMVVGKKVEELIARLAQKARASGIHLVLATQRPSVDVLTGLIKANIPARIAFQVSSRVDSRTILDQMGAEQLLGHGDMLFLPPGTALPTRVHGAFVADHEVHKVVAEMRGRGEPDYVEEVLNGPQELDAGPSPDEYLDETENDPLYDQAVRIVTETRRASISAVQRRLKIGYNRAARMVEAMERSGIVGPLQANGAREVLAPPPPES
jgi:S-DNA-T family DNA segregation ATPase FtsK/SpoIIIE